MQSLNDNKETNISSLKDSLDGLFNINNMITKPTILIVDDEENNLQLLVRTFRSSYTLLTAQNGEEASNIVNEQGQNISLIITDQIMPIMTGVQFLKKITPKYPNIIKILLLGKGTTGLQNIEEKKNDPVNPTESEEPKEEQTNPTESGEAKEEQTNPTESGEAKEEQTNPTESPKPTSTPASTPNEKIFKKLFG